MKRLVFIVEGDTEIILVQNIIVPYLIERGFRNAMHAQTITTNRKQHKKGGVSGYLKFKNEVTRTLAQGNVIITSFIDFFKLPTDFPAYTSDSTKIAQIEQAIHDDFHNNPAFIPYIQRHELEALMFSGREGFDLVIDDLEKLNQIDEILEAYSNPEDINNHPDTAPSKRLIKIFGYDKVTDGELILDILAIDKMIDKCPRFAEWLNKIIIKLSD